MVKNNKNEVYITRKMVQLLGEPLPLRAGSLVLRAVQHHRQHVGGADGIIAVVLQVREVLEIIGERNSLIAVELMVAERRINRNLFLSPPCGFAVPHLPVVLIGAFIDEVASERDERGIGLGNRLYQCLAHGRIRRVGVLGIMESGISIGD